MKSSSSRGAVGLPIETLPDDVCSRLLLEVTTSYDISLLGPIIRNTNDVLLCFLRS